MSAPIRFLTLAVIGWIAMRSLTGEMIPGAGAITGARGEPGTAVPPIVPTEFPPLDLAPAVASADTPQLAAGYYQQAAYPPVPAAIPIYYYYQPVAASSPAPRVRPASYTPILPEPSPLFYPPNPQLDDWRLMGLASMPLPRPAQSVPAQVTPASPPPKARLDRLQLTAWALLRGRPGEQSLATGGTLGGSQAGARLTYALDRRLALSLRSSSAVGGSQSAEVAGGVRLTPFSSIPVSLTAERRQAIGRYGGRSAFALFLEGGVYERPILWRFNLDGYAQAGVVGARDRALFADGGFTLTRTLFDKLSVGNRPLLGQVSAGFGAWGGVQPGLYRVDAGPRLSMRVRGNMRVHLDWRQRLAGTAHPGSGPALTLAGDF